MRAQLAWRDQDIIDDEQLDQAVEAARNDFVASVKKPPDVPVQAAA